MSSLPHGGPLALPTEIAEFFMAHVAAVCADPGTPAEHKAVSRRAAALAAMTADQRATAAMLAQGLRHLAQRF